MSTRNLKNSQIHAEMASSTQAAAGAPASTKGPVTEETTKGTVDPVSSDTASTQASTKTSNEGRHISIHDAAREGDTNNLVLCLGTVATSSGADIINSKDKHRRTPLHLASFKGNVDCIKLLVSSGSQVNAEAQDGITPLQFAVQSGNLEAAKELLLSGANVDCKMKKGKTPLMTAAAKGQDDLVKLLLEHQADISAQDKSGKKAEDYAKKDSTKQILSAASKKRSRRDSSDWGEEEQDLTNVKQHRQEDK
eukprot:gb/GECG01001196.1/.p1 GENE.gb/GECG01001196.1/~~gb/GECG01001196.1/.p1  ORF type:complete len:251 (+),score=46.00 gb/GECG01001196.1/:1-753(+)